MSIKQPKKDGHFWFDFTHKGHRFRGVCDGCKTEEEALAFEASLKAKAYEAANCKSRQEIVKVYMDTSAEQGITLVDAYERSLEKPRRRTPGKQRTNFKRNYWNDFVAFMKDKYPDIKLLGDVIKTHAEAYIAYLRNHGRYNRSVTYQRGRKTIVNVMPEHQLSSQTLNEYHTAINEVFQLLFEDARLTYNPFEKIFKLPKNQETREAFTEKELTLILSNLDPFTYPLFYIAFNTGLRKGDICLLKWSDIDFEQMVLHRRMNKTGKKTRIPMLANLAEYLQELNDVKENYPERANSEYILPNHAAMYKSNPSGISYRIKRFLNGLGIETQREVPGRSHKISVKDFHSCRHTFCWLAARSNININVVRSIVGHMTPRMTEIYMNHATDREKIKALEGLPFSILKRPVISDEITEQIFKKNKDMDPFSVIDVVNGLDI